MMALGNFLIKSGVEVPKQSSSVFRPMIEHHNDEAEVDERDHANDTPKSLCWIKEVHALRSQVRECTKKQAA